MRPPCRPAPGPMSMTRSAERIVSSSCSTTRTVLPMSRSCWSVRMSRGCRAGAGRWSARRGRSSTPTSRCRPGSPGGCAGPRRPRGWPRCGERVRYRCPTSARKRSRWRISRRIGGGDLALARRQLRGPRRTRSRRVDASSEADLVDRACRPPGHGQRLGLAAAVPRRPDRALRTCRPRAPRAAPDSRCSLYRRSIIGTRPSYEDDASGTRPSRPRTRT